MIAACLAGGACGPLRLDSRPVIRGSLAAVDARALDIRHKTGRVHRVWLTPDTRIIDKSKGGEPTALCPGLRVTVLLVNRTEFTASSVTVWSGRCE
jgi:hypothetical protein